MINFVQSTILQNAIPCLLCRDILSAAAALPLAGLAGAGGAGVWGRGGEAGRGGRLVEAAGLERGAAHGEGGPLQIRQGRSCFAPENL